MSSAWWKEIKTITDREGTEVGTVISSKRCTLSGCGAQCLGVRWPDGKLTWPCLKGMKQTGKDMMQIL